MNQNNQADNNEVFPTIPYNNSQGIYNQNGFSWESNVNMRGFPFNNNSNNNDSNNENTNSTSNSNIDSVNCNNSTISNTTLSNYSRQQQYSINPQIETNIQQHQRQRQQSFQKETVSNPSGTPAAYPSQMSRKANANTSITSPYINMNEPVQSRSPTSVSTNTPGNDNIGSFPSRGLSQDTEKHRQQQVPSPQANPNIPSALFSYPIRKYISNLAILKFYDMVHMINNAGSNINKLEYWRHFINEMFTPSATMRYSKTSNIDFRKFDFLVSLIPLIFITLWKLGVVRIEVAPQQIKCEVLSNSYIFISCPKATFTYHYADASYITHFIQFKGIYSSSLKLEFGDLCMHSFVPGIEWNSLERLLSNQQASYEIFQKLSNIDDKNYPNTTTTTNNNNNSINDNKTKNKTTKEPSSSESSELPDKLNYNINNNANKLNNNNYRNNNQVSDNHKIEASNNIKNNLNSHSSDDARDKKIPPNFDAITQLRSYFSVFRNVSVFGSQEGLMRVMQVSTVMSALKNLRAYQKIHGIDSPLEALEAYVQKNYNDLNPGMPTMGNNNGKNNNQLNSDRNNVASPTYPVNPSVNQTINLNTNNQRTRSNYTYTESSRLSTDNQVSEQRTVVNEDNGTSQTRYEGDINNYHNNTKPVLKRRRESGISPHTYKAILSPNMGIRNDNDDYNNNTYNNYNNYNVHKKPKN